jgi:hypothetical protein
VDARNLIGRQLWPRRTPAAVRQSVLMNVVAAAWLAVSSIQVTIWVLMCVIGWQLAYPFWIWTVVGGPIVLAIMGSIVASGGRDR